LIEFEVIDQDVPSILGLPSTVEMNLVHRVDTIDTQDLPNKVFGQYSDVLGCISDPTYHINIEPSCKPVIHPPHRVPVKLQPKIQEDLSRMKISRKSLPQPVGSIAWSQLSNQMAHCVYVLTPVT